jgi:predicted alpha/beta hydrolase
MNSPDAPGLILARAGFDVWLGNNRGNYFSKSHVHFTPDQKEFWEWDWEEMGTLDLPAMIDYILITTDQYKLRAYIGHS